MSHGGCGVTASTRDCASRSTGSNPVGHPYADAEHLASSAGCNPVAPRCGGSTPPVRINPWGRSSIGRAPRLHRGRSGFDSRRLHSHILGVETDAPTFRPVVSDGARASPHVLTVGTASGALGPQHAFRRLHPWGSVGCSRIKPRQQREDEGSNPFGSIRLRSVNGKHAPFVRPRCGFNSCRRLLFSNRRTPVAQRRALS